MKKQNQRKKKKSKTFFKAYTGTKREAEEIDLSSKSMHISTSFNGMFKGGRIWKKKRGGEGN